MGLSSVDATKVLRICAVRAIRSARLACLPLLDGFRLRDFAEVLTGCFDGCDFEADAALDFVFALPAFAFAFELLLESFFPFAVR